MRVRVRVRVRVSTHRSAQSSHSGAAHAAHEWLVCAAQLTLPQLATPSAWQTEHDAGGAQLLHVLLSQSSQPHSLPPAHSPHTLVPHTSHSRHHRSPSKARSSQPKHTSLPHASQRVVEPLSWQLVQPRSPHSAHSKLAHSP